MKLAQATTPDEVAAVQRLRHDVYVEEFHRSEGGPDDRFAEPDDDHRWIFHARIRTS